MSIEFVVFVVAVVLLIAYRNLGSGAISSAGGNVASGMKTALGWLAGTGRDVAGSKIIILLVWALFLAAVWYFDPTSWKELVIGHWKMFVFLNMLAIGLLFFATQWGMGATLVTFAIIGGIILMMSEPEKPKGVAQAATKAATTGKFCWYETEKGTGWQKDVKNESGCFSGKILEYDKTHLLVKYKTKDGYGTCDWDKLKDPQYGEWKEVGRNNGGNCMLTQVSEKLFTGWFESHYDTKGRYIPGYRDKYYVELRLN